jgi:hypothetical protein
MKKGLRDFSAQPTDIAVSSVWTLSSVPDSGGVRGLPWGVLGNDTWGDCYWASSAHEFQAIRHRVNATPSFDDQGVLDAYGDYLGLYGRAGLEATPNADQGTDAREGARFRREHGIQDAAGHSHYIGAYAFESNPRELPALIDALGAVTVCVELTNGCEEEFQEAEETGRDFVWEQGGAVAGGHAISGVYWTPEGIGVVSWGREGVITYDYLERYMQTAVVYFTRGQLEPDGETPTGLNKAKLVELVKEVRDS